MKNSLYNDLKPFKNKHQFMLSLYMTTKITSMTHWTLQVHNYWQSLAPQTCRRQKYNTDCPHFEDVWCVWIYIVYDTLVTYHLMGAMPTISLSTKEKTVVTAPCGETSLSCMVPSTHQFTGTVIATPKLLCKPSNARHATSLRAEVLSEMMEKAWINK